MFNFIKWLFFHLLSPSAAHYINGGPSLPPPLTPEQEKALLIRMMAGDAAARDDLITHNLRLVVYLAKKYENSGVPQEDMISIGTIGLIKAVNTFTPARNIKLATYASRCIGNEILMYLRKSSNRRQEASIDEPLNSSKTLWACNWSRPPSAPPSGAPWSSWPPGSGRSWSCASALWTAWSTPRRKPPMPLASAKATSPGWKSGSSVS